MSDTTPQVHEIQIEFHRQFSAIHFQTGFKVDLVIKKDRPFSEQELQRREPGSLAGRTHSQAPWTRS